MFKKVLTGIIRVYQRFVSPDTGLLRVFFPFGACRYHPTCSEYGYLSIKEHGVLVGSYYAIKRILRCNPLSDGGYDPIIKKRK